MNIAVLRKIESYGDVYKREYLDRWDKKRLLDDWKYSLEFFFDHSFMRGRRDQLSIRFKDRTLDVLRITIFENPQYDLEELTKHLVRGGVNNSRDRAMVSDAIRFIRGLRDSNLTSYFIKKLAENETAAYNELDSIQQVADKIATLYLRDLCWMFDIRPRDYNLVFPIDTWLSKIVQRVGLAPPDERSLKKVKSSAVDQLLSYGIDPIKFNAGAWYLGTHSLEVLLDNLERIKTQ